jgi:hypothetical protein
MNYSELSQQIRDYIQSEEPIFLANLDGIIRLAEQRIDVAVHTPDVRKTATGNATTQLITTPADFSSPASLFITNGSSKVALLLKDPSYLTEAFGVTEVSAGSTGTPAYYAIQKANTTSTTLLLAPSPDVSYPYTLYYMAAPGTIVTGDVGAETWVSVNFPQTLLYGCLVEAYTFLKGDPQMQAQYEKLYQLGILEIKKVVDEEQRTDSFRNPEAGKGMA